MSKENLIEIKSLHTQFFTDEGVVKAVDNISFSVRRGEVLGIVGESGCGKSVTALSIMRLIPNPPGRITEGIITFEGRSLLNLSERKFRHIRGNRIAMIFQDPMTSLNPVFTIGNQICEAVVRHQKMSKKEGWKKGVEMLAKVGIPEPEKRAEEYPHQLSGGMRQRVMIAIALSCEPDMLIADEPTTALDVTIQAQILDLMKNLRNQYGMAIIFITHDLGVIAENADNVCVMYAGKIIEKADVYTIFENPAHPYTQGLINSIPVIDEHSVGKRMKLRTIQGIVPNLLNLPPGCRFKERCNFAFEPCSNEEPFLWELEPGHYVACFLLHRK
ncbi:MAG: ABC transporter ATP-binding protein [Candidatus Hodarchaeota archaeon]